MMRPTIPPTRLLLLLSVIGLVFAQLPENVGAEDNITIDPHEGQGYRPGYPDAPETSNHLARRGQAGGVYMCTDTLWRGQCWWTLPNNWGCMDLQSSRGGNVGLSAIGPDAGGFVSIPDLRNSLHADLAF